jgi:hypothetical protein
MHVTGNALWGLSMRSADSASRALRAKLQAQFAIKAMHALVVDRPAFSAQHDVDALVTVPNPGLGELSDTSTQRVLGWAPAPVRLDRPRLRNHPAGPTLAHLIVALQIAHRVPTTRCAYH